MERGVIRKLALFIVLVTSIGIAPALIGGMIANAQTTETEACIIFTKKGEEIGERICRSDANDVHLSYHGKCVVQFTNDSEPTGAPIPCPKGSNDFHVSWNGDGIFTDCHFTKKGENIGGCSVPAESNDVHVDAKKMVLAYWTRNGERIDDTVIPAPAGANDFHLDLVRVEPPT